MTGDMPMNDMSVSTEPLRAEPPQEERRRSPVKIVLLVVAIAIVTSVITVWLTLTYLFPREFKPVKLTEREVQELDAKLARLDPAQGPAAQTPGRHGDSSRGAWDKEGGSLKPERYSENDASRMITLSERELNGLLAMNTDLASKVAIDLSRDMASAKLLIPIDPDFPFLGGKTLRVSAGLVLRYDNENPVVMLKGVSLWGVPIPNAWLGGIKNVDLVREFGDETGFWQLFAEGVENIQVEEGKLSVKLKE
jgi:hypothetical protein